MVMSHTQFCPGVWGTQREVLVDTGGCCVQASKGTINPSSLIKGCSGGCSPWINGSMSVQWGRLAPEDREAN